MEFLQEILGAAGADTLRAFTVIPGFGGYFKGIKSVCECSPQKIVLALAGVRVAIEGEGLSVGRYFRGDMFVSGAIKGVSVE